MICSNCESEIPDLSKFCLNCGADLRAESCESATPTLESEEREDSGEYRYLTVMFIDLVGSTRLSEKLSAEAYRRLVLRYRQICVGPVRQFGGYVAKYLGDGILVYFGYPNSHEDNAARACHAAIEIHEAFEAKAGEAFRDSGIRIGIHSGRVLISSIDDGEVKESHAIVGRAPNLAARLQDAARVNQTVVSRDVTHLLGELFQLSPLGVRELKGIAEPVELYSLDARCDEDAGAISAERSPLVEREQEKEQLLQKWAALKDFQTVAVTDQSGIGKSALIQWFLDTLEEEKIQPLTMSCSPYEERSPFTPIIRSLEKISGADLAENPEDRSKAYDTFFEELGLNDKKTRAALKHFVGLQDPWISQAYSEDPEGLRTYILGALVSFFTTLCKEERQLVVLEDAQWVDPSTLDILKRLFRAIKDQAIFLLVGTRGRKPPLASENQTAAEVFDLQPLSLEGAIQVARDVDKTCQLNPVDLQRIVERSDGIPLFVRELTQSTIDLRTRPLEHGAIAEDATPLTLTDALSARMEGLGASKSLAQVASVIGRRFTLDSLAHLARRPVSALLPHIEKMIAADVIVPEENALETAYRFRLSLFQSIVYDSLLDSRKEELHGRYLSWIETFEDPYSIERPERMAEHAALAQRTVDSVCYLKLAGERSAVQSSLSEAVDYFREALALLSTCSADEERDRIELSILVALGGCLVNLAGAGAKETVVAYKRAVDLCDRLSVTPDHVAAYWGWWFTADKLEEMERRAQRVVEVARGTGAQAFEMQAHHCAWGTSFQLGRHEECLAHIHAGLDIYQTVGEREQARLFGGHDMAVCGLGEAALTYWLTGRLRAALNAGRQAVEKAEALQHVGSSTHALDYALTRAYYARDLASIERHHNSLSALAGRHRLPDVAAKLDIYAGWHGLQKGRPEEGLKSIRVGLGVMRELGGFEDFPIYISMEAEALLALGRAEEAYKRLTQGEELEQALQFKYWTAEIARLRGLAAVRLGRAGLAASSFVEALDVAASQGARMLELRSLTTSIEEGCCPLNCQTALQRLTAGLDEVEGRIDCEDTERAVAAMDRLAGGKPLLA